MNEALSSPCCFCGYKGKGYWQVGTHHKRCPWRDIGGHTERDAFFYQACRNVWEGREALGQRVEELANA